MNILSRIIGPDIRLSHSKINMRAARGGSALEWHQDWAFVPHTAMQTCVVSVLVDAASPENGAMQVIKGSHKGPLLEHHDDEGFFAGAIHPRDPGLDLSKAVSIVGGPVIREEGRQALVLTIDLLDSTAIESGIDRFIDWSRGRVDVLVNAAGIPGPLSPDIGGYTLAEFDAVLATNLRAPFAILSRLLPVMRGRKTGRVVNIGGNHGMRGRAGRASYSTSKWGLRGLSRSAALEAGPDGVTVNYIAPGPIAVARMRKAWAAKAEAQGADEDTVLDSYIADMGIALGRTNEPEDIVNTVLFLVGPGGRNITGQEIVVDGGVTV